MSKPQNAFKQLEPREELPVQVKEKTMGSLRTVQLVLDLMDLFVLKSSLTAVKSFQLDNGTSSETEPSNS